MVSYGWWMFVYRFIEFEKSRPGVYELSDESYRVIYIGCAQDIKVRLMQHLIDQQNDGCLKEAKYFRVEYAQDYEAACAERLEEYASAHEGQLPMCNRERLGGRPTL